MLNFIRKNAQSVVIQAVVVIIAVVFVFWGVGAKLKNSSNAMAVVNGKEIGAREFQQSYQRAVEQYKQRFGDQLPAKLLESLRLKEQVLDQLVQRELLRQGAQRMGIRVGEESVRRKIQEMEVFSRDGRFDQARYKAVLESNRLAPATFESGMHDDLLMNLATEMIGSFAEIPDAEVEQWGEYIDQEIKVAYAEINSDSYRAQVNIADDALTAWYAGHKEQYKTSPQVRLAYLAFASADHAQPEQVSDEAVRNFYKEHLARYRSPEQRRARHILIKVEEDASAEVKAAKKAEAEKLLQQIRQGADFATLAQQVSEDASKDQGGDLGFFRRGQMVAPFEESVFSLKQGEVSGVVASPFGYHIIRLEEIRPAAVRPLEEVSQEIRQELARKEGKAIAFKKASATYEEIIRAGSLAKFNEKEGATILHTEFFQQDNPPKMPMADDAAFAQAAFALRKGELSSIVETASGYAILFAEETKEPAVPELAAVRERVVADYTREKSAELARSAAESYLGKAKETGKWPEGLAKKESAYIKRFGPAAGVPEDIRRDAFARLGKGVFPERILGTGTACLLYQILDSRQGKSGLDAGKRSHLAQGLLADQKNTLLAAWLNSLRKEAKIWINAGMMQ